LAFRIPFARQASSALLGLLRPEMRSIAASSALRSNFAHSGIGLGKRPHETHSRKVASSIPMVLAACFSGTKRAIVSLLALAREEVSKPSTLSLKRSHRGGQRRRDAAPQPLWTAWKSLSVSP